MKKYLTYIMVAIIVVIAIKMSYIIGRIAVSNVNAYKKSDKIKCLIVYKDELGTYYRDGLNKQYVTLIGQSPYFEISDCFEKNHFLLNGSFQSKLSNYWNESIFKVDSWEFVFPITRHYVTITDEKSRIIYPLFTVDDFDIKNREIIKPENEEKVISFYEAELYKQEFPDQYFIITPEVSGESIEWYIVDESMGTTTGVEKDVKGNNVKVFGKTPEKELSKEIIFSETIAGYRYANSFLIHGTLNGGDIDTINWWLITPFEVKSENTRYRYLEDRFFKGSNGNSHRK